MSKPPWAASNPLLQIYRIKANLTLGVKACDGITVSGILLDQEFRVAKTWLEDICLLFFWRLKRFGLKSHKNWKLHNVLNTEFWNMEKGVVSLQSYV